MAFFSNATDFHWLTFVISIPAVEGEKYDNLIQILAPKNKVSNF